MDLFEKIMIPIVVVLAIILTVLVALLTISIFTDDIQELKQCSEDVYLFYENGNYSIQEREVSTTFIIINGRPHPTLNTNWNLVAKFREREEAETYCKNYK